MLTVKFNVYGLERQFKVIKFLYKSNIDHVSVTKWNDENVEDHTQYQIDTEELSLQQMLLLKSFIITEDVEAVNIITFSN